MSVSEAWLLEPNEELLVAISDHEIVEHIQGSITYPIPGSPEYCNKTVFWQGHLVPVIELDRLLGLPLDESSQFMTLIAFQSQPDTALQYLALKVNVVPRKIMVDDDQVCELPEKISKSPLNSLCLSCFVYENKSVLILDMARLCSAEYRDSVNS